MREIEATQAEKRIGTAKASTRKTPSRRRSSPLQRHQANALHRAVKQREGLFHLKIAVLQAELEETKILLKDFQRVKKEVSAMTGRTA
jgi:hypothetical protein